MKIFLEILTVNGTAWDIEFSYSQLENPIEIISVNKLPAIYLTDDFKNDCILAGGNFLLRQETKGEEDSDESRGN